MENILFAALTFLTTLALCEGRVVKVPDGPLVRVEGQDVAILCTVSNYEGPRDQDFEWIMVQAGTKYQIVSTFDSRFPDDLFKDRVASGAISIKKLSDSSAELLIKKVRATDSATYQCSTPSTDTTTSGNYEADVELRVIGDSLTVVPSIPKLAVSEGEQLELYCNATRSFSEHTSLSVTWSLKKNDVLTFGPDDKVTVGGNYAQRYADGGLRLDLRGGGLYGLAVLGARPEDQGKYVCTAREWVRQADGSLTKILEKSEDMGKVTVTPTAQSMAVTVAKNTTLNMEDTLNLTCSVAAGNTVPLALEVEWLKSDGSDVPQVLIRMDRDGTVTGGSTQLGMFRVTTREFQLILQKVEQSNSGQYSCRVRAWLPQGSSSKWYQAAEVTSQPVQILVTQLEPEFTVSLSAATAPQFTYDPTELHCAVSDILNLRDDARLGVTWTYQDDTPGDVSSGPETIATLNEQGTLVPGSAYEKRLKSGDIALSRGESNVFKLRLVRTRTQDMGAYSCSVVAWSPSRQGGWEKAKETPSAQVPIRWSPKTPVVSVMAHRVREASSAGSTFEMSCQVTGQNLQNPGYSVLVRTEEKAGAASRKVLSLSPDSVLQLEEWTEPGRVDSVALEKTGPLEYRFRLYGAQLSDRGFYYCDVTAFTREQGGGATGSDAGAGTGSAGGTDWSRVVSGESNKIQIAFEDTGPVFNVSIHSEKHSVAPGETAKLQCIIEVQGASPNRGDVSFEVQWFHSGFHGAQNGGAEPLISMDRWGLVRKNPAASSSANQTAGSTPAPDCSLERSDAHTYTLSVHGARSSDAGEYHCIATPWLLAPASGSWTQGTQLTSPPAYVSIRLALWESVRLPLLYGVAAACGVGLISILLGLMCAQCCCRNNLHTPRSGNKLMDMEMD